MLEAQPSGHHFQLHKERSQGVPSWFRGEPSGLRRRCHRTSPPGVICVFCPTTELSGWPPPSVGQEEFPELPHPPFLCCSNRFGSSSQALITWADIPDNGWRSFSTQKRFEPGCKSVRVTWSKEVAMWVTACYTRGPPWTQDTPVFTDTCSLIKVLCLLSRFIHQLKSRFVCINKYDWTNVILSFPFSFFHFCFLSIGTNFCP